MAAKNVTVIPATINLHTGTPKRGAVKRNVAGYARVSTDSDEQYSSYEAQVDYYTKYIQQNPDWTFAGVYTDEGISAVMTKHRDGFNQMIADALAGKIDLIVTKSVSRFARNTVDSLTTVRKLKEKGVEVYFQKENIYTLDSKGELLITIMSSLAQEESRSISENVTWGRRKQFADGKVCLPYGRFLGYEKGPDGLPQIVPEQAKTVVYIFDLFLTGLTPHSIAKRLTQEGLPTPSGKCKWQSSTIKSILSNEKYKGDALLQKEFTVDFLQKKKKINEGEVPQYYVKNSHPAIISPEIFDRVQVEIQRRQQIGHSYNGKSIFSARIICGDCGAFYGPKIWNSNNKYRKVVWQCNNKFKGETCKTPHLSEEEMQTRFLAAFDKLLSNRDSLVEDCQWMLHMLTDTTQIDLQLQEQKREQEIIIGMAKTCVAEQAVPAQENPDYEAQYTSLTRRYEMLSVQIGTLEKEKTQRANRADTISLFLRNLVAQDGKLTAFDPRVWLEVIDIVTVYADGRMIFRFVDGREVDG